MDFTLKSLFLGAFGLVSTLAATVSAEPAPHTFALIVANNRSTSLSQPDLQYADDDGARYYQLLRSIAGDTDVALLTTFDRASLGEYPQLATTVKRSHPRGARSCERSHREGGRSRQRAGRVDTLLLHLRRARRCRGRSRISRAGGRTHRRVVHRARHRREDPGCHQAHPARQLQLVLRHQPAQARRSPMGDASRHGLRLFGKAPRGRTLSLHEQ